MPFSTRLRIVTSFVVTCLVFVSYGQGLSPHNWYFGNSTSGIFFNKSDNEPVIVTSQRIPYGNTASAVATDPITGDILFYSDGFVVYDKTGTQMPNGGGLTGNSSANQGAVVCPVPGEDNKYYLFTNSADFTTGGTIRVTTVDMALFGNAVFPNPPLGDVETKDIGTGITGSSEGMVIVPKPDTTGYWLVSHVNSSSTYSVLEIGPGAFIGNLTTYNFTSPIIPDITVSNISWSAANNMLAVSPQDMDRNVQLLDFDPATGVPAFNAMVFNSANMDINGQAIFDTEWSPNGNFLYISRHGGAGNIGDVLQYDVANATSTLLTILPTTVNRSYGLQIAPDGKIYHLYQQNASNPFVVGRINSPDSIAAAVDYELLPLGNTDFVARQFPATLPPKQQNITLDFTFSGTCANVPTIFTPVSTEVPDSLFWDLGDGNFSNAFSPIHTYDGSVTPATVRMFASFKGQIRTVTKTVPVQAFDLQLQLVQDTVACRDEFPPPRGTSSPQQFSVTVTASGSAGTPTFAWSNGDTGDTLFPDSAGFYYVIATIGSCQAYASVNIQEYGLIDQRANIWYFGDNAGIDFNPPGPTALNDGAMIAEEGCTAISNTNGEIIFYTNGSSVYDVNHNEIAMGLGGETSASQSVIAVPVPNDETLWYLFTNEEVHGDNSYLTMYSIFDIKLNGGTGGILKSQDTLFTKSTERITSNNNWVILHEYGNNTFRAYPMTQGGIGNAVLSTVGEVHRTDVERNGQGYMKMSPDGTKLAVALSTDNGTNFVELFSFTDSTGVIADYTPIDLTADGASGQVYGLEFSPGGNKLFVSVKNPGGSQIFEYRADSLNRVGIIGAPIPDTRELGALQTGPDGQIYVAANGSSTLGTIQVDEDTASQSSFNAAGFALAGGTTSRLGLPNFVQNNLQQTPMAAISVDSAFCVGDSVAFSGLPTSSIDNFQWIVRDAGNNVIYSSVNQADGFLPPAVGDYDVSLTLTNRCGLNEVLSQTVTVVGPPPAPTIPVATSLCGAPSLTLDANTGGVPNLTYLWSTGETTQTIQVTTRGFYSVTITNPTGCTSSAQSFVDDSRPAVDLGPDLTICQDDFVGLLDAGVTGAAYQWQINGSNSGNGQTQAVNTSVPGTFVYSLNVIDGFNGCVIDDTVTITVNPDPVVVVTPTNSAGCGLNMGILDIDIQSTGLFSYVVTGPAAFQAIDIPGPTMVNLPNLQPGVYSVTINDLISGCTELTTVSIQDNPTFTINSASPQNTCAPVTVDVDNSGVVDPLTLEYTLTNTVTSAVIGPVMPGTEDFSIAGVNPGDYILQITADGCVGSSGPFTVSQAPQANVEFTVDECVNPVTVTAFSSNATVPTFSWTGPGTFTSTSATINPPVTGAYTVTVSDPLFCDSTSTVNVNVLALPAVSINLVGDPCDGQLQLDAVVSPSGTYSFQWNPGGLVGQSIGVTSSATYTVTARNQVTGCTATSTPVDAIINQPVTVSLSSTPACDDGNPFTLTAAASGPPGLTFSWFRDGAPVGSDTTAIQELQSGLYMVIAESTEGCQAMDQLQVDVFPFDEGQLPNRVTICPQDTDPDNTSIELDPGPNFVSFTWRDGGGQIVGSNSTYVATSGDTYSVDLINGFGCATADTVDVVEECLPRVFGPNAFRPGGANPEFFLITKFLTDFNIFIYDRWGKLVFQSGDRDFRWDGTLNGELLPAGTYAWKAEFISEFNPDRGMLSESGGVVLLR